MSHNAQSHATQITTSPEPAHQDKRSVVIPFEPAAPSHTSSVLDAIEQSGMPLPTQDARSKRPTPPPRRYREQARRLVGYPRLGSPGMALHSPERDWQ